MLGAAIGGSPPFTRTRPSPTSWGGWKDWVVVYYETDGLPEGQCTIVTETRGPIAGQRVVRGREQECWNYWANADRKSSETPASAA